MPEATNFFSHINRHAKIKKRNKTKQKKLSIACLAFIDKSQ